MTLSMELLLHGYVFRWDKYMCVPSLQDMWHIHVTAWSFVVIKPRGSKRLIP